MPRKEVYVVGMVPKRRITSADMKDAQIKSSKEEYVLDMVLPRERLAIMKDVPIRNREEEYVVGVVQKLRNVVMKDVAIILREEESVADTVQKLR